MTAWDPATPGRWVGDTVLNRAKAHEKHGHSEGGSMETMTPSRQVWVAILGEEFGEVCRAMTYDGTSNLRDELIDVISVASAWVDSIDRKSAEPPPDLVEVIYWRHWSRYRTITTRGVAEIMGDDGECAVESINETDATEESWDHEYYPREDQR